MIKFQSLTLIWKRSEEQISTFSQLPVYLSLTEENHLALTNTEPPNGLFDYCIEIASAQKAVTIRPQDAHFDLYIHTINGEIIQVTRPQPLNNGDRLSIDETKGAEWVLNIQSSGQKQLVVCSKCHQHYLKEASHCPHCAQPQGNDTIPSGVMAPKYGTPPMGIPQTFNKNQMLRTIFFVVIVPLIVLLIQYILD